MNAIQLLKEDHRKVAKLFRDLERQQAPGRKRPIGDRVLAELDVHAQIEEEIFYPAIRERSDDRAREMVAEAVEEHRIVKDLVSELKGRAPEEETYDAQFKVLRENVEHHVGEEENELFPRVQSTMGDELDELGTQLAERKRELQSSTAGSVGKAIRGLVSKAIEAVAGSEPSRRSPKSKERTAKAKTTAKAKAKKATSGRSAQRKAGKAAKSKRASAKTSSTAASRTRARSRTAGARKRPSTAAKPSVKRARPVRARTSRKRAAARKR